jgi:zinc transport system substrate-binding protein
MPSLRTLAFLLCASAAPVGAEVPRVVTDIAPVQGLVSMVMAGLGTPDLVVPAGGSPHDFAMRPSQARSLSSADLVVWIGPALTAFLEGPIETLAGDAEDIRLIDVPGTLHLPLRERIGEAEHAHAEGDPQDREHDEPEAPGHDVHDHAGGVDPHLWLDPRNAVVWLDAIAAELSRLDPDNAPTYRANAAAGQARLATLEAEIATRLHPVRDVPYVVLHDAYHYFEDRFDLRPVAAVTAGDAARPGAARLSDLRVEIANAAPVCAFFEPQMSVSLLDALIEDRPVTLAEIDPMGIEVAPGAAQYETLLRNMAQAMADCLSGAE